MTFTLVRPGGFTDGTRFYDHELNPIQENIALALDTRGGTYTQTDPIVFSGSTWTLPATTFTGAVSFSGNVSFADETTLDIDADISVSGASTFVGSTTVQGVLTSTSDLHAYGNTIIGNAAEDTLQVAATAGFGQPTGFADDVTIQGELLSQTESTLLGAIQIGQDGDTGTETLDVHVAATTFHENVTFAATAVFQENLSVQGATQLGNAVGDTVSVSGSLTAGAGCSVPTRFLAMPDANTSVAWGTYNEVYASTLNAERTLTLETSGVPVGATICVTNSNATYDIVVGSTHLNSSTGHIMSARFVYSGSSWVLTFPCYVP